MLYSPSYSSAALVKAYKSSVEDSPLNRTRPFLPDPKISPIVLSSNGTTEGLSCFAIQFLILSSIDA